MVFIFKATRFPFNWSFFFCIFVVTIHFLPSSQLWILFDYIRTWFIHIFLIYWDITAGCMPSACFLDMFIVNPSSLVLLLLYSTGFWYIVSSFLLQYIQLHCLTVSYIYIVNFHPPSAPFGILLLIFSLICIPLILIIFLSFMSRRSLTRTMAH